MMYDRIEPSAFLASVIDCYWIAESNDRTIRRQKIIPDGFPEIIFHYRDAYRINISGDWELQGNKLLAGQIRNHFLLENTGSSGMIGIKFKPAGITQLFELDMSELTDKVVALEMLLKKEFSSISEMMVSPVPYFEKVDLLNRFFEELSYVESKKIWIVNQALDFIFEQNGMISVAELTSELKVSERKLERLFRKYVGLSPKFYTRIIRFNYIFKLVKERKRSWSEIAQFSGFYDQSHFIKNFQEFTGEDPSGYFFEDKTMANFFLNRSEQR